MQRTYEKWESKSLGNEMELLVFGHAGIPVIAFPTSRGRFYDFENFGMVEAIAPKIERGELQLYCLDSVDSESWYAEQLTGRQRIERQVEYETYVMKEVVPFLRKKNHSPHLIMTGCSLGGYHAATFAFKHPDQITALLTMGGAFDVTPFLHGYYDTDCYFNLPTHFLPNLSDPWYLNRMRHNSYILATGVHDKCWNENERLAALMRRKGIPVRLDVWQDNTGHGWHWWRKMFSAYL